MLIAAAARVAGRDVLFGIVSVLLLIRQLLRGVLIGLSFHVGVLLGCSGGRSRQSVLALVVRESLQAIVDLLAKRVVHVLQVVNGHGELRTVTAVALLAAADEHAHLVVGVRRIVNARENVALRERALRTVCHVFAQGSRDDKRAVVGIERFGQLIRLLTAAISATIVIAGLPLGSVCGFVLLLGELGLHFVRDGLLHFGSQCDLLIASA